MAIADTLAWCRETARNGYGGIKNYKIPIKGRTKINYVKDFLRKGGFEIEEFAYDPQTINISWEKLWEE